MPGGVLALHACHLEQQYGVGSGMPVGNGVIGVCSGGPAEVLVAEGQLQTKAIVITTEQGSSELQYHINFTE